MIRRPFFQMAVGFLLGIIAAAYAGIGIGGATMLVAMFFTRRFWVKWHAAKEEERKVWILCMARMGLFVLFFFLGSRQYQTECKIRDGYLPYLSEDMQVVVQGKLDKKEIKNTQYVYELSSCILGRCQWNISNETPIPCNRILVYSDSDIASIGEILVLNGTIELWEEPRNEGNFDEKSFYLNRKVDFKLKDIQLCGKYGRASRWREGAFCLRNRLKVVYQMLLGPEEAGILCAMVLGDKSSLDVEAKQAYKSCGLSHIMAISGLHVAVIGMALYRVLRKIGIGFLPAGVTAGTLLWGYGMMVGMGTSVSRAVGMFFLLLFANVAGRSYDALNALGLAALVLLFDNPYLLWDSAFQFSFAAVLGIVCVGKCIDFTRQPHGAWLEKLFVAMTIQLVTLPLTAWHSYEVPIYAMPVNLVVLPVMGVVLTTGIAGGVAGVIVTHLLGERFGYGFAAILLYPCKRLLQVVTWFCGYVSGIAGALQIVGRPKLWQMMLYYIGLAVLSAYFGIKKRRQEGEQQKKISCIGDELRKFFQYAGISMMLLCILFWRGNSGFELDILDVGQGDASFLHTSDGYTIFVDGGSTDVGKVGIYRILPFLKYRGVRGIDYWIVSHTDEDHISGLQELLEQGYPVRHLVFAGKIQKDDMYINLVQLAKKSGGEICYWSEGDILHLGRAKLQVLSPIRGIEYRDKNAASLVFRYEEDGFSGIFTGDIGSEEEELLIENEKLEAVTFYKVAHHGSKNSSSEELLAVLRPEISTISCGKDNRYGHPHEETVERLDEVDCKVLRTDQVGAICITVDEDGKNWGVKSMK